MIEEIKIKVSALEYEINMLDIDEESLTGVDVRLKELKELVKKLTI
jgi:ppGpp synthetase/RelA/SpoT-type nucleotidyltranferase